MRFAWPSNSHHAVPILVDDLRQMSLLRGEFSSRTDRANGMSGGEEVPKTGFVPYKGSLQMLVTKALRAFPFVEFRMYQCLIDLCSTLEYLEFVAEIQNGNLISARSKHETCEARL
jgi:hypothetical protein